MSTMAERGVPMPMTTHPHYERKADTMRTALRRGHPFQIYEEIPLVAEYVTNPTAVVDAVFRDPITLDVKRCAGPAPFVGDPIWEQGWYFWRVAVDDLGRHVAGDAEFEIVPRSHPDT